MIDDRQQAALALLAAACRPKDAPTWDAPGIAAAIAKVAHRALPDVMVAVARAAADVTARTPGAISATNSAHWGERVVAAVAKREPRPEEACPLHAASFRDSCACCAADRLAGEQRKAIATTWRPDRPASPERRADAARLAREAIAAAKAEESA